MFEGTDSLFNLEFTYAKFLLRSQKLKIPTAITETQNIYCDHRNFDSVIQPLGGSDKNHESKQFR